MPANNVTITGSFTANSYTYTVKHWYRGLDGEFHKDETVIDEEFTAAYGTTIATYPTHAINGYSLAYVDPATAEDNKVANLLITENEETNVINVYYDRNSYDYEIRYYKDTDTTEANYLDHVTGSALFGTKITADTTQFLPTGYEFTGIAPSMIIDVENNVIHVVYTKKTFKYTVEYYYDDVLDVTEEFSAKYLEEISTYAEKPREGYSLEHVDTKDSDGQLPLVISNVVANNVIRVYYAKPNISIEKKGPATAHAGDNITYTITLKNTGKVAGPAEVTDTLPTGVTFVSADNNGTYNDGTITWSNLTVAPNGGTVELKAVVKINSNMIGKKVINTATLTTNGKTSTAETTIAEIVATIKEVTQGETGKDSVNIILVMDLSYSMKQSKVADNSTTRLEAAKTAATQFINTLYSNEDNSEATVTLITFNTKEPVTREVTTYVGITECEGGFFHNHSWNGCKYIDGKWYSEYEEHVETETVPYSGTSQLGSTVNKSNYSTLTSAISNITLPDSNPSTSEGYSHNGLGTYIGAALDLTETTIQHFETTSPYSDNKNVVIFLSDGAPDPTNSDNNATYIANKAASIIAEPAEMYPIGFGKDAGNSGSAAYNVLLSMSSETPKKVYTSDSVEGLVGNFMNILEQTQDKTPTSSTGVIETTLANTLVVNSDNPITGTYNDVEVFRCTDMSRLSDYCITYDSTTKKLTFDINAWNSVSGHTQITSNNFVLTYYIAR